MASGTQYQIELLLGARKASSFSSNMSSAAKSLDSIQSTAKRVAVGVTAAFAGINLTGAISDAMETYTGFEQSITNTSAIAGASKAEFSKMEQAARDAGKSTTKTAAESSEALGYMALAGWDVDESIEGLMPVLKMSESTQLDLATTSDLVTDSMSALKLSVKDLPEYLDTVVAGNNNANMTSEQMMQTMIRAGGAARTLGVDYQDLGTAAGILANNGTKGEQGGTALNAMLTRMASNDSAIKQMDKLGISIFDAQGEFIGLEKALQNINKGISDLSTEEQAHALKQIAGTQYYSKMNYLLDSVKEGAKGTASAWDELNAELEDSEGSLDAMNEKVTGTTQGAMARMTSALDDAKISFGDAFNEEYIMILDTFASGFNDLSEGIQDFAEENEIEIHHFFEGVMDKGKKVVDFVGNSVGFVVDHFDLISSGIEGVGAAIIASKAISGIVSLASAFAGLTPAGMAMTGLVAAAGGLVAVSEAIRKADKRAAEANLDEHFGDISLSLEQIDDVAQQIVGKKQLTKISTMLDSIGKTDEAVEAAAESLKEMESLEWKMQAGLKLTKDDKETYIADVENYVKQTQDILDSQGYSVSVATDLLLGKDSQLGMENDAFYAGLNAEMDKLQKKLNKKIKKAVENGVDIPTDEAIQKLLGEMDEITSAITDAEQEADFQALELKYSGKDLDADSFQELSKDISKYEKEAAAGAEEAYHTSMTNLNARRKLGDIDQNEYNAKASEIEQGYFQTQADAYSRGYDFMMNTVKEAYPELETAMAEMQTLMDQEMEKLNMDLSAGISGEELSDRMYEVIQNVTKGMDVDKTTKGVIETMFKDGGFGNMLDQMVSMRNQMLEKDVTVPENLQTNLEGMESLEALTGGVDEMYAYLGNQFGNSPEYSSMLLAASETGGGVPESFTEGIRAKTPEAQAAATELVNQIRTALDGNMIGSVGVVITPSLVKQAEGGKKALNDLKSNSTTYRDASGKDHTIYQNALGGIYDSEILTTVAEQGAEAIIPLDGSERGKSLWYQAGKMMGMFGNVPGSGGSLAAGVLPAVSAENDRVLYESLVYAPNQNTSVSALPQDSSGTQDVTITYSPNITIQGNADQEVVTQALDLSQQKFNQMMENYLRGKRRVSFS